MRALRQLLGAILVGLVAFPAYRVLRGREIGIMGSDVLLVVEQDRALMQLGTPIILVFALILARTVGMDRFETLAGRIARWLGGISAVRFAVVLGSIAAAYATAFSLLALDGKPNLIDSMTQLLHARFVAAGHLAGPADRWNEFWHVQNSLVTPRGWVSHFPPGHVMLLAAGFWLGAVWAVGPVLCGVTVFFVALIADRLFPDDRAMARLGTILAAGSPFFIAHAGAYMNHVSAAAFGAMAIYSGIRARDGSGIVWPAMAGAATAAAFTIRPLAAIASAATVALILASRKDGRKGSLRMWVRASVAGFVGASPFLIGLGAYNMRFFGSPFSFGYPAAWGPASGLGFHRDPWGNAYDLVAAVGFTSSDLTALSLHLLGTPIPVVLVVGIFLVTAPRLTAGERIVAAWALLPVAANALYWHHGMFMGPRMLNESAPAWALLAAVSAVGVVRRVPRNWEMRGYSARTGLGVALALAAPVGILYLGPDRLRQYGGNWMTSTRMQLPPVAEPALVFVHGGWTSRIGMRLAAAGLRLDSLETVLRLNPTCEVHRAAQLYPATALSATGLDLTARSDELRPRIETARGNFIRVREGQVLSRECVREATADTLGIVDIAPLVWQGDLPGEPAKGPMVVRDMGPTTNAPLIAAHPDRMPLMFMRRSDDSAPILVPYGKAMSILWPRTGAERNN